MTQVLFPAAITSNVKSYHNGQWQNQSKQTATETAIALSYNGTTHAVMMATPKDLIDFAIGFSLTEGIIQTRDEIKMIDLVTFNNGIDIQICLHEKQRDAFQQRRRHMAGPVGCGLCGIESIDAATRSIPHIQADICFTPRHITHAIETLSQQQELNHLTHAVHAAGFYHPQHGMLVVREDVGRHNALDKLAGAVTAQDINPAEGSVVVTSRLSVEMVQKTAILGSAILIGISSPTAHAISISQKSGITLIARARGNDFEIYSSEQRICSS